MTLVLVDAGARGGEADIGTRVTVGTVRRVLPALDVKQIGT
jgi:hypothetical protein